MSGLYAFAFCVLNFFGCFGLSRETVEVILGEHARVIVRYYDGVPCTAINWNQRGPMIRTGEARYYFKAHLRVKYDTNGRAVSVSPFVSP